MKLVWDNGAGRVNRIEMAVDYKGSNGMSDHLYPYSAKYYLLFKFEGVFKLIDLV